MNYLIQFIKIIISGCLSVLFLSIINIPYFYTGIHITNETGATDYAWESGQLRTNMTEGYAWLTMDRYGFNNTEENAEKAIQNGVDILLMGSSHMEAVEVAQNQNLGYLLNENISGENTYNIGISGHDIYRVIDNISDAIKTYEPRDYVIIETYDIELEQEKMEEVIEGRAKKIPSYDSGIVYQLQKIPAIKWIYKSLDEWASQSRNIFEKATTDFSNANEKIPDCYKETLNEFLRKIVLACEETDCIPVIFYHQQAEIQTHGTIYLDTDERYLEIFKKVCDENDILFVDMTEDILKNYDKEHILPHGFINTYVGNGHMNAYGHRIVANKLLEVLYAE